MADAFRFVRPSLANPRLTVLINLFDGKDLSDHGFNIRALVGWELVEPVARQPQNPNKLPYRDYGAILVNGLARKSLHCELSGGVAVRLE